MKDDGGYGVFYGSELNTHGGGKGCEDFEKTGLQILFKLINGSDEQFFYPFNFFLCNPRFRFCAAPEFLHDGCIHRQTV